MENTSLISLMENKYVLVHPGGTPSGHDGETGEPIPVFSINLVHFWHSYVGAKTWADEWPDKNLRIMRIRKSAGITALYVEEISDRHMTPALEFNLNQQTPADPPEMYEHIFWTGRPWE